jgi:DeoR family transcriptional regulator of aga operon
MKRRQEILATLLRENTATVRDLAERFGVSPMTIYRDLQHLEAQGLIIRTVGGAMIRPTLQYGRRWSERLREQAGVKRRLGAAAAALLRDRETVIFDAGTTVLEVARHLNRGLTLTAVTNSLPTAATLGEYEHVTVLMPGGQLSPDTASLLGPAAVNFLADINADTVVLSTAAVSLEDGLTNFSMDSVAIKRVMIARARRVILVVDYTKFEQHAMITVEPIDCVDHLVSDSRMPDTLRARLEERGIRVTLVPAAPEQPYPTGEDVIATVD